MTKVMIGSDTVETRAEVAENQGTSALIEDAVRHDEGRLAKDGPLVVATGRHTGRSAKDKFIVQDAETADTIWWGKTNVPMTPDHFAALKADFLAHLADRPRLYRQQLFGGSQAEHRVAVQVVTEYAWHSQFIRTLLCRPTAAELAAFAAEYTIIDLPSFRSEEHTSELQSLMRISYAVFCL